jgi:hypothetical protein
MLDLVSLWYAFSFPNESGIDLEPGVLAITLLLTAALNLFFAWAVVKFWGSKFVTWHLKKVDSLSRDP